MKILIIDDEPLARSRLRDLIDDIGGHEIIGEACNGRDALNITGTLQPELLLLDIRMPEMNGIEVAMHLSQLPHPPAVIFTTAYEDHALKAFEANAIDYLLKPIRRERLEQALNKVRLPTPAELQRSSPETEDRTRKHICAHHRGGLTLIPIEEIIYFQADSKYVAVHHLEGEVLIEEPLKALEREFNKRFTRIHRSTLVANNYIETLSKHSTGQHLLTLRGIQQSFEVSRRQLPAVRKIISELS